MKLCTLTKDDPVEYVEEDRRWVAETLRKWKEKCDKAGIEMPEVRI